MQKERIYKGKSKSRTRASEVVGHKKSLSRSPHDVLYDN